MNKDYKISIINILSLIIIMFLLYSFSLYFEEKIVLKVDSSNKEKIEKCLANYTENVDFIEKVAAGHGWNSGHVYLYNYFGGVEELIVSDGDSKLGELDSYIRENGYSLDAVATRNIIILIIGLCCLIIIKINIKNQKLLKRNQ